MLRISSFKAFVISNLIHFVLTTAIGVAAAFSIVALRQHTGWHPPAGAGLRTLDSVTMLSACLSVILSSLIAGFVAGRIAEYRPVLHGALSSCILLIQEVYSGLHNAFLGWSITLAFAALLFGALGGYGAAQRSSDANRYNVTPVPRNRFVEPGLMAKLLLSLAVTACVCAFIFFSPTIFCNGGGAGGNCGEAYMISIPAAVLALPIVFASTLFFA